MKAFLVFTAIFILTLNVLAQNGSEKKTVNLEIKGMTCSGCVKMIEASLKKIDGMTGVEIDLEKASGVIQYDPQKVKEEAIVEAIEKAGGKRHSFKAKKVIPGESIEKNDLPDCCKPAKQKQDSPDCCAPSKGN